MIADKTGQYVLIRVVILFPIYVPIYVPMSVSTYWGHGCAHNDHTSEHILGTMLAPCHAHISDGKSERVSASACRGARRVMIES